MEIKINRNKFYSLPEAQRKVLLDIGVCLEEKKEKPKKKIKSAVSHVADYYLGVKTTCRTCGTTTVETFLMQGVNKSHTPNLTATCPIGIPVRESIEPDKWLSQSLKVCKHCREKLQTWDKKDLVNYILHRTAACHNCPKDNFKPSQVFISGA